MSDLPNPIEDTYSTIKSRLAGPIGTFVMVWGIGHPKVMAFLIFDATGNSGSSQADTKIRKISELLSVETAWYILWRPVLWTILVMISFQIISLVWHWVGENFRYLQERITLQKDFRISLFRRFAKNPDDLIANVLSETTKVQKDLEEFPRSGDRISAVNAATKNEAIINSMLSKAEKNATSLKEVSELITMAKEGPLMAIFRRLRK
jgi:hypothetical protein